VTGQRQPSKKTFDFFFSGGTLGVQGGNLDAKKHKCLPNKTTLGFSPEGRLASKLATAGPKMHGRQLRKNQRLLIQKQRQRSSLQPQTPTRTGANLTQQTSNYFPARRLSFSRQRQTRIFSVPKTRTCFEQNFYYKEWASTVDLSFS